MAKLDYEEEFLRWRLCGHLRRVYVKHEMETQRQMAERMGMNEGHFSALYRGEEFMGLDIAVKLANAFNESLDHMCLNNAPEKFWPPGWPMPTAQPKTGTGGK